VAALYDKFPPRLIAAGGFIIVAAALTLIAFTIRNEWTQALIVTGLILLGLGQGAIVALVFNTLLSSAPKELAGDVGAWRGLVHNLSGSVGIAVATVFAVTALSGIIQTQANAHPDIPASLIEQVNFDNVNFLTNEQLESALAGNTDATQEQVDAAVAINEDARLLALKVSLLGLAALALLAIVPALRMPGFRDEDLPERLSAGDPAPDVVRD
jgi:MFS family permease